MLLDYYGRVIGKSLDHPDNDPYQSEEYQEEAWQMEQEDASKDDGSCSVCGKFHGMFTDIM